MFGRQKPQKAGSKKDIDSYRVSAYSEVLKRIIKAKSNIYIDSTVISEFTRVGLRKELGPNIKSYRGKSRIKKVSAGIVKDVECIIQTGGCLLEHSICQQSMKELLSEFAKGYADFNDLIIVMLCKRMSLTLLTDDIDFSDKGVKIITANPKLLSVT